jgi:hypothetical protein
MHRRVALVAVAMALVASGCGSNDDESKKSSDKTQTTAGGGRASLPQGREPVKLDPADFTNEIDNPYWPMAPGSKWEYRSKEERIVVSVTGKKKKVEGIEARVLRDTVTDTKGDLVEVTDDWYAQDTAGNVWYLGEDTKEYKNGKVVSTSGSWENGVDGAEAGIIMPAEPRVGVSYRQEYYKGEAEDRAKVLSVDAQVTVPFGTYDNVVETQETTPLEPNAVEHKFYAKSVGAVLRTSGSGKGREELVSFNK